MSKVRMGLGMAILAGLTLVVGAASAGTPGGLLGQQGGGFKGRPAQAIPETQMPRGGQVDRGFQEDFASQDDFESEEEFDTQEGAQGLQEYDEDYQE